MQTPTDANIPIDAVVTWVDGNDPAHKKKKEQLLLQGSFPAKQPLTAGITTSRFADNNELFYCLSSIRKFAPWVRKIYIVTDDQAPTFLTETLCRSWNIEIVDHRVIFETYEWALPTFNSISIETAIWRIPGLSDRFIYFNDDFSIMKPVGTNDFFEDNKVVLPGEWRRLQSYGPLRFKLSHIANRMAAKYLGINRAMSAMQQMRAAELAGFKKRYYHSPHVPHPVFRKTLAEFYSQNADIFRENIRYPFRDASQHVSIFLANHLEIARDTAIFRDQSECLMICGNRDTRRNITKKIDLLENGQARFLCIQSVEELRHEQKRRLYDYLDMELTQTRSNK